MSENATTTVPSTRDFNGVAIPAPGKFVIDASHSTVQFVARHMMVSKVRGTFLDYAGTVTVADDPLDSSVEVDIQAASITTRDEGRDGHLQSADFFDVENHPVITFRSTGVTHTGGSSFRVDGDLTIRGVSKSISLDAELEGIGTDPWGNERVGFSSSIELDREDFGLTWNQALETGGVLVSKKIKVDLDVEASREA